jgi:MFS transporter, MHS family, proline/betaine transporter
MLDQFTKNICAVGVGNILEWYDFAIFGALADILGESFFPSHLEETALVASLSLFGSAFFMRPIGGWLMGYVGDNYGRKRALEVSVATMVIPSFLMGCLPTYQQIGWTATVCLIILRLLQGLAVGGEMTGAFVFTIEATNGRNRGVWGAIVKATGLCGTALGMGYVAYLRYHLSQNALRRYLNAITASCM